MKHVFSDGSQVAHLWAHQSQQNARNSGGNFYFDGETIYSYGGHFPIARVYNGKVLFTLRTYSNTTAKHIRMVSHACSHMEKVYMQNVISGAPDKYQHEKNLLYWANQIQFNIDRLTRARKKEIYLNAIAREQSEMRAYCDFFKIKLNAAYLK